MKAWHWPLHALKKAAWLLWSVQQNQKQSEEGKDLRVDLSSFYCISFEWDTIFINADDLYRIWKADSLALWRHMLFIKRYSWQVPLLTFTACDCVTLPPVYGGGGGLLLYRWKGIVWHFEKYAFFAFLPRLTWEDWCHSHICKYVAEASSQLA